MRPTATCAAQMMVQILKQCGNDLTRENMMKQAANLKNFKLPMLLPGDEDQYQPDQLQPDPADAARELRRPKLAAVRRTVDRLD